MSTEEIKKIIDRHINDALESGMANGGIADVTTTFTLSKTGRPSLSVNVNYAFAKDVRLTAGGEA